MDAVTICNGALALIGQGVFIDSMDEQGAEAEFCRRVFDVTVREALEFGDWSFARKDELMTEDYLLPDVVSLPWKYTYKLPENCTKVLRLTRPDATSITETMGDLHLIPFNLRNYRGQKVLTTDKLSPFAIHYMVDTRDYDLFSAGFISGLQYLLAAKLTSYLVKGTEGAKLTQYNLQIAYSVLGQALAADASQGGYSMKQKILPAFARARR